MIADRRALEALLAERGLTLTPGLVEAVAELHERERPNVAELRRHPLPWDGPEPGSALGALAAERPGPHA